MPTPPPLPREPSRSPAAPGRHWPHWRAEPRTGGPPPAPCHRRPHDRTARLRGVRDRTAGCPTRPPRRVGRRDARTQGSPARRDRRLATARTPTGGPRFPKARRRGTPRAIGPRTAIRRCGAHPSHTRVALTRLGCVTSFRALQGSPTPQPPSHPGPPWVSSVGRVVAWSRTITRRRGWSTSRPPERGPRWAAQR